jgi:quercetin dioxygenase-like cupin family protein
LVLRGKIMNSKLRSLSVMAGILLALPLGAAKAPEPDLDPAALTFKTSDQLQWKELDGSSQAVLYGDPDKEGLYAILIKWHPHHTSRPHFHMHDRFITVLSGTWWVNTGLKYDPDHMVAMHPGTYVTHYAKQIHYDGAKDEEAMIEIVGEGPAKAFPAEQK